jgi:predicted nucleic acid-binding protein
VAAEADARGNLVPDAHLVALMVENGVRMIWTRDRDCRRFRGIEARDPFE